MHADFNLLSLRDLIAARDLYHLHLMSKQHVVGTAVGRYLIRDVEPWPKSDEDLVANDSHYAVEGRKPPRTLNNSAVRPYSWPCVLVFVDRWEDDSALSPDEAVPRALLMPNGTRVPVCIVRANPDERVPQALPPRAYPGQRLGGGYPLLLDVQGRQHIGSVGCLVADGRETYALTNRHVVGPPGEPAYALICGKKTRIGVSSDKQLTRKLFTELYPTFAGERVYVNMDVGLIRVEDVDRWTAQIYGLGQMGRLADVNVDSISLRLLDQPVCAYGAVSGVLDGTIKALFYRYKSLGGFEYVSEFLIGPRVEPEDAPVAGRKRVARGARRAEPLRTRPGDSGTVWFLRTKRDGLQPLAMQWGAQAFLGENGGASSPFVLATALSSACRLLEVDVLRDWNLGTFEYWGAVGHYSIATRAVDAISGAHLKSFFRKNLERISFGKTELTPAITQGLSKAPFVPLADVPDLVWKMRGAGSRGHGDNSMHFADMDAPDPSNGGRTLLALCLEKPRERVRVEFWKGYYERVNDGSRGSLPFRAWQIFDAMSDFAHGDKRADYLCAAGILAHYIGDACQPLHISRFFNGDPDTKAGDGVHHVYEADMVNRHTAEIVAGLGALSFPKRPTWAQNGQDVAIGVVRLMK